MPDASLHHPAEASFQPIAQRLEAFFRARPRAISRQAFPNSPTGWVHSAHRFVPFSFEVEFEPPDAPNLAHVRVDLDEQTFAQGDVSSQHDDHVYGWSTLEACKATMDDDTCYVSDHSRFDSPELTEYYRPRNVYEITYAFAGDRWVFQEVFSYKYGCTPVLWRALTGDDSGPAKVIPENAHWLELFRS